MKEVKLYMNHLTRMFSRLFCLVPQAFVAVLFIAVFEAVLPYVNVIAMQLMIDGLMGKEPVKSLMTIVLVTIGINVFLRLVLGELKRRREILVVRLELKFQKELSIHESNLSLVDVESARVKELKRNIEQAKMRSGGVENVIFDFEILVRNAVSLITAAAVFSRIFLMQTNAGEVSFWTSPYPVFILVCIVIISTLAVSYTHLFGQEPAEEYAKRYGVSVPASNRGSQKLPDRSCGSQAPDRRCSAGTAEESRGTDASERGGGR